MALDFTYDPNFGKSSDSELDFTFDATAKPAKKQGIMAELGSSLKRGVGSTIDYGKLSLTDNPDEIAGIVSDNLRNQAPQSAARQKMNTDIQPYAQEASDAQGIMANIGAYGKLAGKRALQLAENPREFAGMVAENLPNSAPGLAGMVAGGVAGAATPIPFGAAIGGIVGGTAGGYKIEQGSSMFDQITKEAQARGIDTNDKASLSSMISEKYPEFLKASQLKGIGTAGTDAALNVATLGVAGMGERTLVKEARTVADLAKAGTITGEEAASALAGIEAKNAARNTIGQKVLRGTSVTAGEMAGESASEAVGQQMAYGKLDPLDVIDEGLLAFGQGVGMAAGRKFISPLVGATDKDTVAQEIERARSFAADLNASVGGDPNAVPTLVTDFGPIQQRIDELHGVDATQMDDKARAQYEKDFEAAYSEVVGYTTDANGLEIPFTAGDYLNSQVRSSDMTRDKPLAAGANDQSANRISQLADEESTQQPDVAPPTQAIAVTPAIPVIGPLSAVANAAVQSGAHQATVMQQAIAQQAQSSSTATGKTESATGNQQAAVAPNISPIAPSIGGVSNAAQPEQVAQKAPQANDAQAGTPATTAQGTGKSTGQEFIATRSDAQLTWLAEKGKGENKDLAKAELARRRGDIAEPQSTSVKEVRRTNHGDGYTGIEFSFGKDGFASVIAGPDGRAYVSNVQIGEADSTERGKGSGTKAYADIGAQLASQGIILESTRWDKHKSAISPAAIGVWEKLVAAGLAKKTGEIQGKIFDRFTSEETVGAVPTYEFVSQNQPEAAPVKSEQPQPAKGAENAQAQTEVLTKAGADTSNAAPAEPTAGQKKAENKAKLDAAIAKRKAENGAVTVDSGIKPKSTAQQSIVKRDLSGLAARDDLVGAIMRVTGNKGIAADMAQTITGDKAGSGNPKLRGLFLNGGTMDLGDVAELLRVQENFDVRDGDHLSELIRNAAAGDIATSMERTESDAVATEEAKRKDYYLKRASELGLKGVGGKRKLEHVVAQVDAKEAEIAKLEAKRNEMEVREERAAIQAENVYDEIAEQDMSESDWMDWLSSKFNYTQEEIDYVQAVRADRENDRAEANAGDDPQGEARGDTGQRQADVTTQAREGGTAEELTLTGQTNSQASAEFKRQQEEATKKDEATASPTVKGDQVDLFNTQDALFNSNRDVAPEAKQSAPIAQTNESVAVDTGNKIVFKDGETRPFSDIAQFLEQHVYGKEIGTKIPNPIFSVGKLSVKTVEDIAALIDGFGEKHANVRVSGYSLKHSDEQRHDKFAAVVADYPKAISGNPEILWNPTRDNSVFVVYPTGNNNLIVLEVAKNGNGTDIVNVITTKDRGMNQYRGKTAARLEGRLAPHPQVSEETPAGGDKFSAVQRAADSSVANQPTEDKPTEAKETDKGVALMEERAVYTVNEPDKLTDDLFQGTENAIPNTNRKTESSGRPAKRSEPVDRERASRVLAIREAADSPGVYNVSAQLVTVGERSLPVATINGSEDAARAFAYLSNYSVEHFDGLVTDADGNPLAVIGSFKGAQTQASVYPGTVMMELARIDGAANLWLSHNHPSGNANLSEADRRLSQAFSKILQGSSVSYRGMSAIARKGNDITWSNTDYDNGTIQANEPAPHRVPIVERMIVESIPGQAMSSPSVAKSVVPAIAKDVPGIVFLTAQNEVGSFVPFDPEEMGELRSGDRLMRLFRSAAKSGATGALVAIPDGKVSVAQFNNLAGALSSIEVNVLDGIRYDSESRIAGASVAETGEGSSVGDRFYNVIGKDKLTAADKAIYGMAAEGKSAADILKFIASASRNPFNRQLAKLLLKTGIAPSITVGDAKGWKFNAGEGNKYSAAYNPKTDMVALFRPAAAERNMLHELVHAATLKALEGKGLAAAQMNALYQHVKKVGRSQGLHYNKATGRGVYGMADIDEFIAEAFTNPKFQDALKKIAAPQASGTLSNAWQWFVRIVKGILGLPANQEDALSAALEIGVGVMRENMKAGEVGSDTRYSQSAMKNINANVLRGRNALAKAVTEKISVHRAMFRNGLGWVDFVWGDEGAVKPSGKTKGAMGLSHIFEARARKDEMSDRQISQLLDEIVLAISSGKEIGRYEFGGTINATVENNGVEAVLTKSAGSNTWLLNGWNVKNPGESGVGNVTTRSTSSTPTTTQRSDGAGFDSNIDDQNENGNAIRYNITGDSGRSYDQSHRDFFKNVGRDMDTKGRIEKTLDYLKNDFWKKMAVGIVDQFRGLRDLNDGGQAYLLARLSKGTAGAFETLLHHGKLSIKDGVYDGDQSGGFIERLGVPLHGELDDFLWYVAANRAEGLAKHERENLFTPEDIAAGKSLANGTTNFDYTIQTGPGKGSITRNRAMIFADANRVFNEFQKNTLDIAEQSGLIDGAARKFWESEFYVPFYRVSEEDGEFVGAKMGNSLVRQQAFKKLKGGADKLNSDLLSNTLLNWSHLIEASAKNRAAKASLVAAEQVGAAHKAAPGEKKTVWFMENGQKVEYGVDDPFVMTAITSLEYAGMRNGIMDVMTKFKHYLTIGVTASPAFKVRNLIRDSIQAIGTSDLGYSPIKNVTEGFQQTKRDSQQYVSALASGGLIRFGTMLEGSESSRVRQLIKSGVKDSSIIDSEPKWRQFYDKYLEPGVSAYNELGNRSEEINRAALYNQLIKQGKSHAEAALLARDLMDFSMQGSFNTIRFLTQVVPFMNARLQGLYKMGRSAKDNPKKLAVVTGAVAMASIALMLGYDDDDDWKRREDWDRDNYWWFKFGGEEWRIPKPFEVGAVGTLAERSIEYMFNDEMTGERFRKVIGSLVSNNLSMNPIPQVFKPVLDLYANKDSFTDRPIETMGMQRLDSTMRYNSNTSLVARGASSATLGILSPVQYDHLARAYFGWLGSFVVGGADMAARAVSDGPAKPSPDYWKVITQGIVREEGTGSSRYVTMIYDQAKELERAHASYRRLIADGKIDDAKEYAADHQDALRRYRQVEGVKRIEAKFNDRIHQVERSDIDPDEKKVRIERINKMKEGAAKRLAPGYGTNPIPE